MLHLCVCVCVRARACMCVKQCYVADMSAEWTLLTIHTHCLRYTPKTVLIDVYGEPCSFCNSNRGYDDVWSRVHIPVRGKGFFSVLQISECLWSPPILLLSGYQELCPWGKQLGSEAGYSPPYSAKVRNVWS